MNKPLFIALAAFAAIASTGAQAAGEADYDAQAPQAVSGRARADVLAEAVDKARNHNPEPAGSRIAPWQRPAAARDAVRGDGAQALRGSRSYHGGINSPA